jgi:DNA-directed RNA polymerase specialized sigma24 family protein
MGEPVTELHPIVYDLAPSVAYAIHRRYSHWVEKEDITQECIAWAITRNTYITEQMSVEDAKQLEYNQKRIAYQMKRAAERYVRKEKANKSGYQLSDEAYYETLMLGQLLPFVIASVIDGTVLEQAQEMIRDGQPRGSSSPAEGGNLLASLIDIKKAFLELDQKDQIVLRMRHHDNATLQQIAAFLECAVSTADRRCTNSLRRLQTKLGGETPYR